MSGQSMNFALVPLPGGAVAAYNPSGLAGYDHPDWEGSWRPGSSPSRTETGDQAYSPCGATYAGNSLGGAGGSWPGAFTVHWQYTPDNLDDAPFRVMAPMMEFAQEIPLARPRWLSPDPGAPGAQRRTLGWGPAGLAAVNPVNPQTWNAYAYVANQPLTATDPLGLFMPCGGFGDPCGVGGGGGHNRSQSLAQFTSPAVPSNQTA